MKFPVTIRHRASKAKIYRPAGKFNYYRLAYATAGKRRMQTFANYSDAKVAAERIVREMASGSQAAALTVTQSLDALAAFERLQGFYQATGRRVSLLSGISEYFEAVTKLQGRTLSESVEGYLRTVVNVKRKGIKEAVTEFCEARKPKAVALPGKRPALNPTYVADTSRRLNEFADTLHFIKKAGTTAFEKRLWSLADQFMPIPAAKFCLQFENVRWPRGLLLSGRSILNQIEP